MENLKKDIRKFVEDRGWAALSNPASLAKSISIESAELLELFQWKEISLEDIKNDSKIKERIAEELADVLIYSLEMTEVLDMNVEEIIREKMKKNSIKYPLKND